MAIVVESFARKGGANVSSVAVTKPSGLAVGDLMLLLAHCNGTANNFTLPSGFTTIQETATTSGGADFKAVSAYKIATSGDVAASTFTVSIAGDNPNSLQASIARISGVRAVSTIAASSEAQGNGTSASTATVTPALANSLICILVFTYSAGGNISAQTIATSPPSFSEHFDGDTDSSGQYHAFASGTRPETTGTGNGTATLAVSSDWVIHLVSISPAQSISLSDTTTITDTLAIIRTLLLAVTDTALSITDSLVSEIKLAITNVAKNVSTWLNQDK